MIDAVRALAIAVGIFVLAGCGDEGGDATESPSSGPVRIRSGAQTVIVVVVDGARADHLTPYGYELETTPNLAALAEEGVVIEGAVPVSIGTNAGMASLFTGLYPQHHGVGSLRDMGQHKLAERHLTLAEAFAERGFRTFASFALPQLADEISGLGQGFERALAPGLGGDERRNARQVFWSVKPLLEEAFRTDDPVFTVLHFADPRASQPAPLPFGARFVDAHLGPYAPRKKLLGEAIGRVESSPGRALDEIGDLLGRSRGSEERIAWDMAIYDGHLAHVDEHLGMLVELLREHGRFDDTLLVVVGSRGVRLGASGALPGPAFAEGLLDIPFMLRFPDGVRVSRAALAQPSDVAPTLAELFELGLRQLDGTSLIEAIETGASLRDQALCVDAALWRHAAITPRLLVERYEKESSKIYERELSLLRYESQLSEEDADEVRSMVERLDRHIPTEGLGIERLPAEDASPLTVSVRFMRGFVTFLEEDRDGEPSAGEGATLRGGAVHAAFRSSMSGTSITTNMRDLPARIEITAESGSFDEGMVYAGPTPLTELPLPRLPSKNADEWPLDENGQALPWTVDLSPHGTRWSKIAVGGHAAGIPSVGELAEVHLTVFPPRRSDEKLEWMVSPEIEVTRVEGRLDAIVARGRTPFVLEVSKRPSEEFAIAAVLGGRVVPVHEMRIANKAFSREGELLLYVPDWMPGVTDALYVDPEGSSRPPGSITLTRTGSGVPPGDRAGLDAEALRFIRRLGGDE